MSLTEENPVDFDKEEYMSIKGGHIIEPKSIYIYIYNLSFFFFK